MSTSARPVHHRIRTAMVTLLLALLALLGTAGTAAAHTGNEPATPTDPSSPAAKQCDNTATLYYSGVRLFGRQYYRGSGSAF